MIIGTQRVVGIRGNWLSSYHEDATYKDGLLWNEIAVVPFQLSLHMHYYLVVNKGAMIVFSVKYGEWRFLIAFVSSYD